MRTLTKAEEKEIVIAYLARIPMKEICDYYHIHRSTIHRVITRSGILADRGKAAH